MGREFEPFVFNEWLFSESSRTEMLVEAVSSEMMGVGINDRLCVVRRLTQPIRALSSLLH